MKPPAMTESVEADRERAGVQSLAGGHNTMNPLPFGYISLCRWFCIYYSRFCDLPPLHKGMEFVLWCSQQ